MSKGSIVEETYAVSITKPGQWVAGIEKGQDREFLTVSGRPEKV